MKPLKHKINKDTNSATNNRVRRENKKNIVKSKKLDSSYDAPASNSHRIQRKKLDSSYDAPASNSHRIKTDYLALQSDEAVSSHSPPKIMKMKSSNSESYSSQYDSEDYELSAYEKKRQQNIAEQKALLESLNILEAKENYMSYGGGTSSNKPAKGLKSSPKIKKSKEELPRRTPSLRIRKLNPEGVALPPGEPPKFNLSWEDLHPRKPSGTLTFMDMAIGEDTKESSSLLIQSLTDLTKTTEQCIERQSEFTELKKSLSKLRLDPDYVAKVTKDRIFSLAINPCESKLLIAAGDKWGKIGFWNVDSNIGEDGVFLFEPHSHPVNCLKFAPGKPWNLYSSSYDGTIRIGDFESGLFREVYTNPDTDVLCSYFDFLSPDSLVVSQGNGTFIVLDTRMSVNEVSSCYKTHSRTIRTIHVHPTQEYYVLTGAADALACIWDLRKITKNAKSVAELSHRKSVTSAFFSPITGNKILTTSADDTIRIFDSSSITAEVKQDHNISHNNYVGRWLTKFRAYWHPSREDVFTMGSMKYPRQIEIFSNRGTLVHCLTSENLRTVSSLNIFHPTRNILIGCSSTGKVMIFQE